MNINIYHQHPNTNNLPPPALSTSPPPRIHARASPYTSGVYRLLPGDWSFPCYGSGVQRVQLACT